MPSQGVSFGRWLFAAAVLVIGVGIIEQYDRRLALGFAAVVLIGAFLTNPNAMTDLEALAHVARGGTTNPTPAPRR